MAWYNASWNYRVKVTVQNSQVDADLTNFPIYVDLSLLPAGFHTNVNQTDGRDIRVTTADEVTEVPREVVFYNSSLDKGELHFKGDVLNSTDVDFYIYYGNAAASEPAASDTYGKYNVWDSNYKVVYHMQEDPSGSSPQVKDSTSNQNHLVMSGSMPSGALVDVKLGKGINFDGSNDVLTSQNNLGISGSSARTVSLWHKPTSSNKNILGWGINSTGSHWDMLFYSNTIWCHWNGVNNDNLAGAPVATINTLFHTYTTFSGGAPGNVISYVNTTAGSTKSTSGVNTTNGVLRVGAGTYTPTDRIAGWIDELRISSIVRSTTWMSTEYKNQNNNSTFFSIDSQETNGGPPPPNPPSITGILSFTAIQSITF